ncbi:Os02g0297000, partial [Oryza sativa Japonica Group]
HQILVSPKVIIGLESLLASASWNWPMRIIKSPIVAFLVDSVKEINLLKEVYPEVTEFKEDAAW